MKKKFLIILGILAACLLAWVLAGSLGLRPPPEGIVYREKSIELWVEQLNAPVQSQQEEATAALKALGSNAVPGLIRLLNARDSFFRRQVWTIAPKLPSSLETLIESKVRPPNAIALRISAARSLAIIGPEAAAAVPALTRAMWTEDAQVRWNVARALGRIGSPALPVLSIALTNRDPNLRYATVTAFGESSLLPSEVVPGLLGALDDKNDGVRVAAQASLAKLGPIVLPFLSRALANGDTSARKRAARALPMLHLPREQAVPPLVTLMRDSQPECREQAIRSLSMLGIPDKTMLDTFVGAIGDPALEVRLAAIEAVSRGRRGATAAVPELAECLHDRSPEIRQVAARTLGGLGPPARTTLPRLYALAADGDEGVRLAASEAVEKLEKEP